MMKVVLDCNVLISAGITDGICRKLLLEVVEHHQNFFSPAIIEEFLGVIKRPKFKEVYKNLQQWFRVILDVSVLVYPDSCPFQLPDPDDEIVLATALAAKADFIITGNKKHFLNSPYSGVFVLSPRAFLNKLKK